MDMCCSWYFCYSNPIVKDNLTHLLQSFVIYLYLLAFVALECIPIITSVENQCRLNWNSTIWVTDILEITVISKFREFQIQKFEQLWSFLDLKFVLNHLLFRKKFCEMFNMNHYAPIYRIKFLYDNFTTFYWKM